MPYQTVTTYGAPTSGGGLIQISPGAPFVQVGPGQNYQSVSPASELTSSWFTRETISSERGPGGTVWGSQQPTGEGGAGGGVSADSDEWFANNGGGFNETAQPSLWPWLALGLALYALLKD